MTEETKPALLAVTQGDLSACPFCGKSLLIRAGVNAYGRCESWGCWMNGRNIAVPLDDPAQVIAWNTRITPAEGVEESARQALEFQERAETQRSNCEECEGEGDWTHCSICSLHFGAAIDARRAALNATPSDADREGAAAKMATVLDVFLGAYVDRPDDELVNRIADDDLLTFGDLRNILKLIDPLPRRAVAPNANPR